MRPLRTWLYVPGNQPRMLARAPTRGADALLLDLEDAVPPAEKASARQAVGESVEALAAQSAGPVFVRVNGLPTGLGAADIAAVVRPGLAGLCLPKVESPDEVREVDALLARCEAAGGLDAGSLALVVMVESALGLVRAYEIAAASSRTVGVALGGEDFARDLGVLRTADSGALAFARQQVVIAARAAGAQPIDVVYPPLDDEPGLIADTELGRQMGYRAKQVIHPRQVPVVNGLLAPTAAEVAEAEAIVAAAAEAERAGRGVAVLGGRMVDRPVVERARNLLSLVGPGGQPT